ncbi:hypothetical protein E6C60_1233 [Paenibacillus algicola]|uniref:Uncharacterized protein n=1 Tax=Paenibacillus algicola TaxID=2565926 RepID=A0A4P8XKK3_9BACL|nr:hypothetical protein E6C60_1233 [Paenibacillus algicola]
MYKDVPYFYPLTSKNILNMTSIGHQLTTAAPYILQVFDQDILSGMFIQCIHG